MLKINRYTSKQSFEAIQFNPEEIKEIEKYFYFQVEIQPCYKNKWLLCDKSHDTTWIVEEGDYIYIDEDSFAVVSCPEDFEKKFQVIT